MKILVIHGPNLNMLGKREPQLYGTATLEQINQLMTQMAQAKGFEVDFFQCNSEGGIVTLIQQAHEQCQALVINPAAYTHTSVAIRDAVAGCGLPVVEVHLTNIFARESFRHRSLVSEVAAGQIAGFGPLGYLLALTAAWRLIQEKTT